MWMNVAKKNLCLLLLLLKFYKSKIQITIIQIRLTDLNWKIPIQNEIGWSVFGKYATVLFHNEIEAKLHKSRTSIISRK